METPDLKNLILEIRTKSKRGYSRETLSTEYMNFRLSHIHMFDMIIEGTDKQVDYLMNMIDTRDQYKPRYTSDQMDKIMGYTLAQEYVYPNIKADQATQDKIDAELKEVEEMKERVLKQEQDYIKEQEYNKEQKRIQEEQEDLEAEYNNHLE